MWANIFFFTVNPLVIWWHILYIERTINPLYNPRYVLNITAMQGHFAGIVIMGAFLMVINAAAGFPLIKTIHSCKHLFKPWLFWTMFCPAVALYVFVTVIQFTSPFFTPHLAWKVSHKDVCNGLDMRVLLDSSPGEPARVVQFGDTAREDVFQMVMDPDPNENWGFDSRGVYNFTIIGESQQPWRRINYDLANRKYTVYSGNSIVTTGGFHTGRHYVMPALDLRGDTLGFSEACVFDPTLRILEDKRTVFMRSVQFGLCSRLQLCALGNIEEEGMRVAVPAGLFVLMRAGRRKSGCCKGGIIPGIDARG